MDKQFQRTLSQVPMFSKMGKYISNKILKYNRSESRKAKRCPTPPYDYLSKSRKQTTHQFKQEKGSQHTHNSTQNNPLNNSLDHRENNNSSNLSCHASSPIRTPKTHHNKALSQSAVEYQPPVAFYKINYKQVEKNPRTYDFKRSVPHFHNQKHFSQELTSFYKEIPDDFEPKMKGFKELHRMAGRSQIKGSERIFLENPHQNRFVAHQDKNSIQKRKCCINLKRMLGRDQIVYNGECNSLKNNQLSSPDYECNFQAGKKRLNTHILPFHKYSERSQKYFHCPSGISNTFNVDDKGLKINNNISNDTVLSWKKGLARNKTGLVPGYLDTNLNSRMALGIMNLKSLQMNCTNMRNTTTDLTSQGKKGSNSSFNIKSKTIRFKENGMDSKTISSRFEGKQNTGGELKA